MKTNQFIVQIPVRDKDGHVVGHKEVIKYEGLLARAHEENVQSITTELIQAPTKDNAQMAIVRATVRTGKGVFTGLGDACPANVNPRVAAHLLRMAETRAKARALRDAVNVGVVALEELDDVSDQLEVAPAPAPQREERRTATELPAGGQSTTRIPLDAATEAQRRALFRLATGRGISPENTKDWLEGQLGASLRALTKSDASRLIERLQNGANGAAQGAT